MWSRNWLPFRSTWVHPGFSGVNSCWTIFSFLNNVFVDRVCSFSFGRCVVCLSFYLLHLITPLFTASDYPFIYGIWLPLYLRHLITPLFTASDYPFIYGIWLPLIYGIWLPLIYGISLPLWYIQAFLKELQWYVQFHNEITFLIWLPGLYGW
jgi:hypothetical protein